LGTLLAKLCFASWTGRETGFLESALPNRVWEREARVPGTEEKEPAAFGLRRLIAALKPPACQSGDQSPQSKARFPKKFPLAAFSL
jgi:hypothetical protein